MPLHLLVRLMPIRCLLALLLRASTHCAFWLLASIIGLSRLLSPMSVRDLPPWAMRLRCSLAPQIILMAISILVMSAVLEAVRSAVAFILDVLKSFLVDVKFGSE